MMSAPSRASSASRTGFGETGLLSGTACSITRTVSPGAAVSAAADDCSASSSAVRPATLGSFAPTPRSSSSVWISSMRTWMRSSERARWSAWRRSVYSTKASA